MLVFYANTPQEHHQNIIDFVANEKERAEKELLIDKTKSGAKARAARIGALNSLLAYLHGSIVVPKPVTTGEVEYIGPKTNDKEA